MRTVVVLNGDLKGKKFPVQPDKVISLGRDTDATIQILDQGVSRQHSEIYVIGDLVFLKDLGSTNGCYINDEKVLENVLRDGDRVRIGNTVLLYEDKGVELADLERQVDYEVGDDDGKDALSKGKTVVIRLSKEDLEGKPKGAAAEGDRRTNQLSLVYETSRLMAKQKDVVALVREVLNLAVKTTKADSGFVFLLDPKTGKLDSKASVDKEGGAPGSKVSRSIVRDVMKSGTSILSSDAAGDARFKGSDSVVLRQIKSVICAPILFQEKVTGILYLHSSSMLSAFEPPELEAATVIAIQLGSAIAGFLATLRLRKMTSSTIQALVTAMEMRDPKTAGHSERVASIAAHIGREIKASPQDVRRIYLAGLLHDVGKIALSPSDKLGTGHKTRNDHPALGEKLLQNVEAFQDVIPALKHHHEAMDGSGYPDGLRGDKIPLMARLVAVANVFDNLVTHGGAVSNALADLSENAGRLYDERMVKALMACNQKGVLFQALNLLDEL